MLGTVYMTRCQLLELIPEERLFQKETTAGMKTKKNPKQSNNQRKVLSLLHQKEWVSSLRYSSYRLTTQQTKHIKTNTQTNKHPNRQTKDWFQEVGCNYIKAGRDWRQNALSIKLCSRGIVPERKHT